MSKPATIGLDEVIARIHDARRIIVTTHARADGDAIGCVAALTRGLRRQGKSAVGKLHEPPSARYAFMAEIEPLGIWDARTATAEIGSADLIVVVDTCARSQLGDVVAAIAQASAAKLAIDHHVTRDNIVDAAWCDEGAGACAQMIARLFDRANWPIDEQTALLLFAGLATDTGWFRFSNTDGPVHDTAARLIAAGARPNELYERLYLCETLPRVRLMGAVMSTFELHAGGRLAVVRVTRAMLEAAGATPDMTEDLINEPQRMGSVTAAVLLVEPSGDGPVRVSLRSKRGVDVAAVAAAFGGGGHARAAGARIAGTLESVAGRVVPAMVAAVEAAETES